MRIIQIIDKVLEFLHEFLLINIIYTACICRTVFTYFLICVWFITLTTCFVSGVSISIYHSQNDLGVIIHWKIICKLTILSITASIQYYKTNLFQIMIKYICFSVTIFWKSMKIFASCQSKWIYVIDSIFHSFHHFMNNHKI